MQLNERKIQVLKTMCPHADRITRFGAQYYVSNEYGYRVAYCASGKWEVIKYVKCGKDQILFSGFLDGCLSYLKANSVTL